MHYNNLTQLIKVINTRKSIVSASFRKTGQPIIDAYHGEMSSLMAPPVQKKLIEVTKTLIFGEADFSEANGKLYSKSQPKILRQLAADKLFTRFRQAEFEIVAEDVIVCPYSSIVMLEAALATVARPDGVILCPEGFYKSNALHIEKYGLQLAVFPVNLDEDGRIDPQTLQQAIQTHGDKLCAILLTIPGNPLIAEYSLEELQAIGRVLVEEDTKVIIDSTFDQIQNDYVPLAAVQVELDGKTHDLYDQIVTITGLSKGYNSMGPYKIGVATTGNVQWRQAIEGELAISFQRETTAMARVVIEETTGAYLQENRCTMMARQHQAKTYIARINKKFGAGSVSHLGSSKYGPFMALTFGQDILAKAGIEDGWQLADMLLATIGVATVAGPRMGLPIPTVRINIDAPRIGSRKNPMLLSEMFRRIDLFIEQIVKANLTYSKALNRIGVPSIISLKTFNLYQASTSQPYSPQIDYSERPEYMLEANRKRLRIKDSIVTTSIISPFREPVEIKNSAF